MTGRGEREWERKDRGRGKKKREKDYRRQAHLKAKYKCFL